MISLKQRSYEPEVMDDLACEGPVVNQTLRELEVINRLLGGDHVTIDGVSQLLSEGPSMGRVTVCDCGCGGGDMAVKLVRWAKRHGRQVVVEGIDANPNIVEFARSHCAAYSDVRFETLDVFSEAFARKKYDVITATLFVHHFDDDQLADWLRQIQKQSRFGVVINDIHRHWFSYYSIKWLTSWFSKSPMVQYDAPLSVRRAFTRVELQEILRRAGIQNYSLQWKWAFRWQLIFHGTELAQFS